MDPLAGGAESALMAPEVDIVEETSIKLEHDPDHSNGKQWFGMIFFAI